MKINELLYSMKIKNDVLVKGMKVEILLALIVAEQVYNTLDAELTLTSCTDGIHGYSSLHYVGYAIDLRTSNINDNKFYVAREITKRLTCEYDVVLEKDHIHIEFQPKTKKGGKK